MATGYTYPVKDGEVTEFPEFLLMCARAMGALITMKEDPKDAEIPEEFEVAPFYQENLTKAKEELSRARLMTVREAIAGAKEAFEAECQRVRDGNEERAIVRQRYESMLIEVKKWEPPTEDHVGLKEFMEEQLTTSIEHDCARMSPWDDMPTEAESPQSYQLRLITQAEKAVEYAEKSLADETERQAGRSKWVNDLRASLKE